ncbi:unnamed protein product [Spirodela intermedia]|uniref:DUF4219 domain-containing protein n=1 Tax=Spirodela intermedia TaxID=51605 RepID=A0ABN7ECA7_SPIIN|nr:unnamed protein product [Spirodela intermedia]
MVSLAPSLMLSKTNYHVWAMWMEVFPDSHELWQTIVGENVPKKKDHLALSTIFGAVLEEMMSILDTKKTAKENWEILKATPSKFDALTLSLEQYDDLDKMSLDETIGLLSVHELRLNEHELREEEQTLLARALTSGARTSSDQGTYSGLQEVCSKQVTPSSIS